MSFLHRLSLFLRPFFTPLLHYFNVLKGAVKKFTADNCFLYTSSLTYYTLLSIVPTIAMGFAIAKGFGMDVYLKNFLLESSTQEGGQQQVWGQVLKFSETLLGRTRGGIIAGIGIVLLLWSVWSVLQNIESSFNTIWKLRRDRSLVKKITDYVSIIFLFPIILLLSLSATVYMETLIENVIAMSNFASKFGMLFYYVMKVVPTLFSIVLITSLYIIIPNTHVPVKTALHGGILAGVLFQLFEYAYIHYQIKLTSYNVIYGSFAALPFLFLWIYYSWVIIFLGMEIVVVYSTYSISKVADYDIKLSFYQKKLLSLCMLKIIIDHFREKHEQPITLAMLSKRFSLPVKTTEKLLSTLQELSLIDLIFAGADKKKRIGYRPAYDIHAMHLADISVRLENFSVQKDAYNDKRTAHKDLAPMASLLKKMHEQLEKGEHNIKLVDI